jgi:hypothetical protein
MRILFIWFFFLGWGLLADVFGCEFLGNLQGGGGFVINAIEESVKYFITLSTKVADYRWRIVDGVEKKLH